MKKYFLLLLVCSLTYISKAQNRNLPMPPPTPSYAEGCKEAEDRFDCTDEKLRNMAFQALSQIDIENVIKKTQKDIIFMNTKLYYKEGQLIVEESSMKFHERELKYFEINLSFSLATVALKPHPESNPFEGFFSAYLYLKIDKENKKLIPLPNYTPKRIPFSGPEEYIVYPGCESKTTNEDLKKCMSDNVVKIVNTSFNTELASKLDLNGIQRIFVVFSINEEGTVSKIRVRAPHPKLAVETERVINLLPKMKPGKIENEPVSIQYTLPIVFRIQ